MHLRLRKIRSVRRTCRRASISRFARNERGIQLVELAIVMPIFVLLFAATAEFGRYFHEYTTLAKGARIGARYLVNAKLSTVEDSNAINLVVYGNTSGTGSPILSGLKPEQVRIIKRNSLGEPQTVGVPQTVTIQIEGFEHQPLFDLGALLKNPDFSMNIPVKPKVTMRYQLNTPLE